MINIPEEMTLSGNLSINKKLKWIFSNPISKKLWCAISSCHLRSQYFNDQIIDTTKALKKIDLNSYSKFMDVIIKHLNSYGLKKEEKDPVFGIPATPVIDDHFWHQVHDILNGKKNLKIILKKS